MPDSNRGIYAAFAGVALSEGAYAQQQTERPQTSTEQQAQVAQPESPASRIAEEIAALRTEIERGLREEVAENGETYTQRDLAAQEDMAFWALVMALAAVGTFFISVYVAIVVRKTLDATARAADHAKTMADEAKSATESAIVAANAGREANEIARARNTADLRPYIGIKSIEIEEYKIGPDPAWQEPEVPLIQVRGKISLHNYGRGIANRVHVLFAICEWGQKVEEIRESWGSSPVTLFPDQTDVIDVWYVAQYEGFFKRRVRGNPVEIEQLYIAVSYRGADVPDPFVLEEFWHIGPPHLGGHPKSFGRKPGEFGTFPAIATRAQVIDPGNQRRPADDDNRHHKGG